MVQVNPESGTWRRLHDLGRSVTVDDQSEDESDGEERNSALAHTLIQMRSPGPVQGMLRLVTDQLI